MPDNEGIDWQKINEIARNAHLMRLEMEQAESLREQTELMKEQAQRSERKSTVAPSSLSAAEMEDIRLREEQEEREEAEAEAKRLASLQAEADAKAKKRKEFYASPIPKILAALIALALALAFAFVVMDQNAKREAEAQLAKDQAEAAAAQAVIDKAKGDAFLPRYENWKSTIKNCQAKYPSRDLISSSVVSSNRTMKIKVQFHTRVDGFYVPSLSLSRFLECANNVLPNSLGMIPWADGDFNVISAQGLENAIANRSDTRRLVGSSGVDLGIDIARVVYTIPSVKGTRWAKKGYNWYPGPGPFVIQVTRLSTYVEGMREAAKDLG